MELLQGHARSQGGPSCAPQLRALRHTPGRTSKPWLGVSRASPGVSRATGEHTGFHPGELVCPGCEVRKRKEPGYASLSRPTGWRRAVGPSSVPTGQVMLRSPIAPSSPRLMTPSLSHSGTLPKHAVAMAGRLQGTQEWCQLLQAVPRRSCVTHSLPMARGGSRWDRSRMESGTFGWAIPGAGGVGGRVRRGVPSGLISRRPLRAGTPHPGPKSRS